MQYSAALLSLPVLAAASTIRIDVGQNGLRFTPEIVSANPGDILEFHYHPAKHSVTQSSFAKPCQPLDGGFNSGLVPVASEDAAAQTAHFNVQVNDTKPIWIYCEQTNKNHCQSGMSMVVNQPNNKNTLAAYKLAAQNTTTIQGQVAPIGGQFSNGTTTSTSTGSTSLTTYTQAYSTYTTSISNAATTVTLVQTVTAFPWAASSALASSTTTSGNSGSGSAATTTPAVNSHNAAPTKVAAAGVMMAAGAVALGGLLF